MTVKKIRILAVFILFMPLICCAKDFSPEFVRHVFLNLDMTSFPNSWAPQHFQKGTTMRDIIKTGVENEIQPCKNHKSCIIIHFPYHMKDSAYMDDGWSNYLKIIEQKENKMLVCFSDINDWGTYNVTQPLELKKVKGKFIVTKAYNRSIDGCKYSIKG